MFEAVKSWARRNLSTGKILANEIDKMLDSLATSKNPEHVRYFRILAKAKAEILEYDGRLTQG